MNIKIRKGLIIAASAAALFTAGCASHGTSADSDEMHGSAHGASCSGKGGACRQMASCKGMSACKGVNNTNTDNFNRNAVTTNDNFGNFEDDTRS